MEAGNLLESVTKMGRREKQRLEKLHLTKLLLTNSIEIRATPVLSKLEDSMRAHTKDSGYTANPDPSVLIIGL